jgi:protein-S-isoprenylcysteine O-methyltransferase Ste14
MWIGGTLFVGSLMLCAWTYFVHFSMAQPFTGWTAIGANVAIFAAFAAHHSLFARESAKTAIARIVPEAFVRSVYVWAASLLLIAVCLVWRPVGGELYRATGPVAYALAAIQVTGVWVIAQSVAAIDPLELAGIRARPGPSRLQITGPYRWVRHPLYLGWMLVVFGTAHLTGDRLVFALITTIYLMGAVPFEERSLVDSFGAAYRTYQQEVRWRMVPFVY